MTEFAAMWSIAVWVFVIFLTVAALSRAFVRTNRRKAEGRFVEREVNGKQIFIEVDDAMKADVIAATIRTGKAHFAQRGPDGKVTITSLDD